MSELLAENEIPRSKVEQAKIDRAMSLFTKWFEHLWD